MKLYCSTRGNVGAKRPGKALEKLQKAGFRAIFIDFEKYMDEEFPVEDALTSIKDKCAEMGITCDLIQTQSERTLAAIEQKTSIEKAEGTFLPNDNLKLKDIILIKNEYVNFNGHLIQGIHSDAAEMAAHHLSRRRPTPYPRAGKCRPSR